MSSFYKKTEPFLLYSFTPLENPAIYGRDHTNKASRRVESTTIHCRKVEVKGLSFLRGYIFHDSSNLTVLLKKSMEELPEFFRNRQVQLVTSLPCYLDKNVRAQCGEGVYHKSIEAIKRLKAPGYGTRSGLPLILVYNPAGPFLLSPQLGLEEDYRRELHQRFGITFTRLLTIANMPLGSFHMESARQNQERNYLDLLRKSFNPRTVNGLMCRHQISLGWHSLRLRPQLGPWSSRQ
jgi:radical SAM/Cys-rich protein